MRNLNFQIEKTSDPSLRHVVGACVFCGEVVTITSVPAEQLQSFLRNEGYVQTLFPQMEESEREFFLSGTCGKCWDDMFPER